jgi:putative PIN family toxin of toxin-antitoxin system
VAARVVLDTDVLVAAIRSGRGASRVLLEDALRRRYQILASVPLMLEYEAVLTRPEHLEASQLSRQDVSDILDALASVADPIRLAFLWRPVLPDPDDDMVLETALNGRADLLVTLNRRHFHTASASFRVKVVSPGDALVWLRAQS